MRKMRMRHPLVALTLAIASVLTLGSTAAAVPVTYRAVINGGTITFAKPTPPVNETMPLDESCEEPTPALDLSFSSNTTSSTVSVSKIDWSHVHQFATGATYLLRSTRSNIGNQAGHVTSDVTPHTIASMRVGVVITVYPPGIDDPCDTEANPICVLAFVLHLNGTSTSVSTSHNVLFNGASIGAGVVAFPVCGVGPTELVGTMVTVVGLAAHLT